MNKIGLERILKDFPWLWGICHEWDPVHTIAMVVDADQQPGFDFLTETDFAPPIYVSSEVGVGPIEEVWLHYTLGCIERVVRVQGKGRPWPDCSIMTVEKAIFDDLPLGASLKHIACVWRKLRRKSRARKPSHRYININIIRPPHNKETGRRDFYEFMLENGFDLASVENRISWELKSLTCDPSGDEVVYAMPRGELCIFTGAKQRWEDRELVANPQIIGEICRREKIGVYSCNWYALTRANYLTGIRVPEIFGLYRLDIKNSQICGQSHVGHLETISEGHHTGLIREAFAEFLR